MAKNVEELSVAEIRQMLKKKQSRVKHLQKRREKLVNDLDNIDAEIAELSGDGSVRYKNDYSLEESIVRVLAKRKAGLPLGELAEAVKKSGYQSSSAKFNNIVYQTIHKSERITRNAKTKKYVVSK